jgi:hypothetical protein
MASSTEEKILSSAYQYTTLRKTLQETDYATSALAQSTAYIESIKKEISSYQKEVARLKQALNKEQAEHEK